MKKIVLFIALAVAMTFSLSAGKASALTMASAIVSGEFDLNTLSITTSGTVVYGAYESTTSAYAFSEDSLGVLTVDTPADNTIPGWTTLNENEAGMAGAYYALSKFDPVYVDSSQVFDPTSSMFAKAEAYADDAGNDGYGAAWTDITGLINGGSSGGTITISVDYTMSVTLDTSLDYEAFGYSSLELVLHGQDLSYSKGIDDSWLETFDGLDGVVDISSIFTVSLDFLPGETGDFHLYAFSEGFAGPLGTVVPEPSTYILLGTGIAGLIAWRRKKLSGKNKAL